MKSFLATYLEPSPTTEVSASFGRQLSFGENGGRERAETKTKERTSANNSEENENGSEIQIESEDGLVIGISKLTTPGLPEFQSALACYSLFDLFYVRFEKYPLYRNEVKLSLINGVCPIYNLQVIRPHKLQRSLEIIIPMIVHP